MAKQKICDEEALWIQETLSSRKRHPNRRLISRVWLAAEYRVSAVTISNIERGRGAYKHLAQQTPTGHPRRLSRPQSKVEIEIPAFLRGGPQESCVNIDEATLNRSPILRQMWTSMLMFARIVARHVRRITIKQR